ncbi:hypothetical protein F6X50_18440 [Dickeya dianthicola]|uniref:hypothetical protein n=1 Tax=Dickeya dianthicola TaxID=204039 RepID=UPI00136A6C46|nr:hypothetical protein [Dickeya dianthicola]MCI4238787.1 hypothetical protein [Dickeya dianthicola]MCI4254885.1 hypothetical protein [Dickeya dianthicola]MZG23924.1 hypothetical protein [Dickeya dianthicola]MZI91027.1 hypothetical protein [Dickeya dianthicola]
MASPAIRNLALFIPQNGVAVNAFPASLGEFVMLATYLPANLLHSNAAITPHRACSTRGTASGIV